MAAKKKSKARVVGSKRRSLHIPIKKMMAEYMRRIDIDADYQREKVWSKKDQEQLLDSIVRDIDIPKLYLAEVTGNGQFDFECIDGKQRLLTISNFIAPDAAEKSVLRVNVLNDKFTYAELKKHHPSVVPLIDNFNLDFVIYNEETAADDEFIREIFRRLQLGIRLNSGELLNSQLGTIRDFVFKTVGSGGRFLRLTRLSEKRFSRQFTLAQICINSFHRSRTGEFVRARYDDLVDFFAEECNLSPKDENLGRIQRVLAIMDDEFGVSANAITSRAIAVSAYLYAETLVETGKKSLVGNFSKFFVRLLAEIEGDMELISKHEKPTNPMVLDEFQKYVLQASVEPYSIKRRHMFLDKAFRHYMSPKSKGEIIGA